MNRIFKFCLALIVIALLARLPAPIHAETSDKNIVSSTAELDGVKLHYLTAGRGPTVILLHGYAETSRMWRPIIPVLAEKFTVIAPDLPGHRRLGDSGGQDRHEDIRKSHPRASAVARG